MMADNLDGFGAMLSHKFVLHSLEVRFRYMGNPSDISEVILLQQKSVNLTQIEDDAENYRQHSRLGISLCIQEICAPTSLKHSSDKQSTSLLIFLVYYNIAVG